MRRIRIRRNNCISCLTCVVACSLSHDGEDARNRVVISSKGKNSPIFCRHCDLPECTFTCMTGAMSKNHETSYVDYNKSRCASCYMCIMACPYGVLKADTLTQTQIMKCDMCLTHPLRTPQCVANCPMKAIMFEEVN